MINENLNSSAEEAPVEETVPAGEASVEGAVETDTPEPDADKDGNKDAAPEGAPESYDIAAFAMPDGMEFDKESFVELEPVLRELNLPQDQAGKIVSVYAEKIIPIIAARTTAQFDEAGEALSAQLAQELKADKVVGGKALAESQALAAKAMDNYLPDQEDRHAFKSFLVETGLANNRFLVRILAGAGREISEASTPSPSSGGQPKSVVDKFYG